MAQEFQLQLQPPAGGKAISEDTFQILQDYFRTAGTAAAAAQAARAVASRVPKDEGDAVEGFLWSLWRDVTEVAKQIPHDDPAQDKLVAVVRELRLLPDTGVRVWNVRRALPPSPWHRDRRLTVWQEQLWTDLPVLGAQFREALNGPETSEDEARQTALAQAWVNFHAFAARLNGAGVTRFESTPIWMLRAALEEDLAGLPPALHDCHIMTAAQIATHNGRLLATALASARTLSPQEARMYQGGALFSGPPGVTADRWAFWLRRLRDEAEKSAPDVRDAALRAAQLMEIWAQWETTSG